MRRAFTLVELMITVAIVMILASIAIPQMIEHQYKAKRSELALNVRGIGDCVNAYQSSYDEILVILPVPSSTPDKKQHRWPKGTDFDLLGWSPDGDVRGVYRVDELSTETNGEPFVVRGFTDVDGNGELATYASWQSLDLEGPFNSTVGASESGLSSSGSSSGRSTASRLVPSARATTRTCAPSTMNLPRFAASAAIDSRVFSLRSVSTTATCSPPESRSSTPRSTTGENQPNEADSTCSDPSRLSLVATDRTQLVTGAYPAKIGASQASSASTTAETATRRGHFRRRAGLSSFAVAGTAFR